MQGSLPSARQLIHVLQQHSRDPGQKTNASRKTLQRFGAGRQTARKLARTVVRQAARDASVKYVYRLLGNLWKTRLPQARLLAIHILGGLADRLDASVWELADHWVNELDQISLIDALAGEVLAPVLARERSFLVSVMDWTRSPNVWRRRAAIETVRTLVRIRRAYIPEIIVLARLLAADPDALVQKPLGRALSECGRLAPTPVRQFLRMHRDVLSPVAWREATRGLPPSAL